MKGMQQQQKGVAERPTVSSPSLLVLQNKTCEGGTEKRRNDLHRLLFMRNGLPDGAELTYGLKDQRILRGYKHGNGIVCSCCHTEISPSQFEAHAGRSARRQPYQNIYTSSGQTLHDIALSLADRQNMATTSSDTVLSVVNGRIDTASSNDMCTLCINGGNLIVCDGCRQAFHAVCSGLQHAPTIGDWHCSNCRDEFVHGRKFAGESSNVERPTTRVVNVPEFELGGCVVCRAHDFIASTFCEQTVMLCDQCEKEYHVGCLRQSGICDLTELPKDRWFCCNECSRIHVILQELISLGAELIPASVSKALNDKHVETVFCDGATNDVQWQILNGSHPEHLALLSKAVAIFHECFDPVVLRSGHDLIPVMVCGANICDQAFSGMYCVILVVKSVVVSAGLLRILGREVAELPLVATSKGKQGKGYFQALFSCIERHLHLMNVEKLVLPAAEEAKSIWTKKFGFRKMSDEQLRKYKRDFRLTTFNGTTMLEKEVPKIEDQ